ncbi:response regulator [Halalkalibacter hemicellulosilyticus]|uniref:DNA-binding response regulator n=1 Tax=Halalkalibacter hemicellulosilyticusJCM 9152 TaxID=1236971 RepID=W4QAK4_9BACI|nr:response regulator transcription factor [Halalkalibacter hemicellulosilyticus]GAE28718.1 DNA-binding response regulator [Halalkalibacter hemicellulosilyticusJCM 9152]
MKINLLLVDDHLVVLKGLTFFLQTQPELNIVGQAKNGKEAIEKVEELKPDVVLMDLIMPEMDGIEATKRIVAKYPHIKVIMLTSFSDKDSILPAIKAGAIGYQLKDVEPSVLIDTITAAMAGNKTLHPQVTNQLINQMTTDDSKNVSMLTPREKDVLEQITLGRSNKEIASILHITEKTVKTHITHIFAKMEVQDRTQAAMYAMKNGWFK